MAQKMAASTPNSSAKTNSLSEDDQKLLELAQKAKLVSESELDEFKSMLMDEYSKEYDEKKQIWIRSWKRRRRFGKGI